MIMQYIRMAKYTIEMVVFDMAGTTIDEKNVVYKTLRKAINNAGYDFSLETVLENGAGKEKLQAIKDILALVKPADQVEEEAQSVFHIFNNLLKMNYQKLEVTEFPGTARLFKELKERKIYVVLNTGYNTKTATLLLDKLHWQAGKEYDLLVTADDVKYNRPEPDMIFRAMNAFGITDSSKVIKIGDSVIDIEEGKSANCGATIGVTTGAHTKSQLKRAKPTYVFDSLIEILDIL